MGNSCTTTLKRLATFLIAFVLSAAACERSKETSPATGDGAAKGHADLVLRGGKVVTMDEAKKEAQALAIAGDTVLAVGSDEEIAKHVGPSTKVIELKGKLAIPGFIEAHGHFLSIGDAKLQLDLTQAKTWDEIVSMVEEAAKTAEKGEWIRGRGWHQEKWKKRPEPNVNGLPLHDSLSAVSPDNPVALRHASGHASIVNAKAMELAGIDRKTPNPDGGEIVKDRKGRPIGMLREKAQSLVGRVQAGSGTKESTARKQVELAVQECLANGITSFHDAGASFEAIDLFKRLVEEGKLGIRLWVMVREPNEDLAREIAHYRTINAGDKRLTVRAIKRTFDGALGPHGAWLLEPYSDLPKSTGLNTIPVEELAETAKIARDNDFQLCVHAIGDRANRETLDVFEKALGKDAASKNHRWRIEHAQHLHPDDIPRFAKLGVIAAMQGIHCASDGPWIVPRLGEKRAVEGAYMWRTLKDSGVVIANGTDAPVEDVSAIASFHATVTRKMADGKVFYGDQRLTREEALRSYTLDAAHAAFEEDIKGSLSPGKLADVTVLSRDIMTIPEDEIPETEVLYTIVGGKVAYEKK
jgi:predicted amidohydrolase YtcJ